jgi:shikimate kinase
MIPLTEKNIIITGFMCSGKSTVGKIVASLTGRPFVDTDLVIEDEQGASVSEIFDMQGEPRFRELERGVIERTSATGGQVIALGGGAVMDERNVEAARNSGRVYHLDVSPAEVLRRAGGPSGRPLLDGRSEAEAVELMSLRKERYLAAADLTIATDGLEPSRVASLIVADFEESEKWRRGER